MKLKRSIYRSLYLLAAGIMATACSNIDENDRLIYVKPSEVNRAVLIEDFTGQRCVNCPEATEEIAEIQQLYGEDAVVAVAIHSGPFGHYLPGGEKSRRYPLCTETGDNYFKKWTGSWTTPQPCVIVNRSSGQLQSGGFATAVNKALAQTTPVTLTMDIERDADGKKFTVNVNALSAEDVSGKLQVWILEDDITGTQAFPGGSINEEYVHKHVFRKSVTADIYGDDFNLNAGAEKSASYNVSKDEEWKTENLSVVAFVYNGDGVQQVIRKKVTEEENK